MLPALVATAVAAAPIGYLVVRTAEAAPERIVAILTRPQTAELVARSLGLTAAVTTASIVIGVALALLVARTDVPGRRLLGALAPLPLAVPSYVAAFAWISTVSSLAGWAGATLVLTLCCYPYVYLPVLAALRRLDPATEDVARALGRRPRQVVREVVLPRVLPSAAAGGLLVALYALSDFGAVSILRFDAFTRVIHTSYTASFDRTPAAVLGLLLVVLTLAISWGETRLRRRDVAPVGRGAPRAASTHALGRWRAAAGLAAYGIVGLALAYPVGSLLWWFVTGASGVLDLPRLLASTTATFTFAVLGAAACLLGAVPLAVLAARHRTRLTVAMEQTTYAAHALPGLVVALSLVFVGIRLVPWAYQRTPLLVVAYVSLFLPVALGAIRSAVALSSARGEEVARTLGCTPGQVLRRVTLPLAAPGVAAGGALVLLTVMKELPATLLLRPTGVDTLATSLWTETGVGAYAAAAPYGLALVVLAVIPTIALMRLTSHAKET